MTPILAKVLAVDKQGDHIGPSFKSCSGAIEAHSTPLASVKRNRPSARIITVALTFFTTEIPALKREVVPALDDYVI